MRRRGCGGWRWLRSEGKAFFFEKKKQKTFISPHLQQSGSSRENHHAAAASGAKVFCFFFSKKKAFLPHRSTLLEHRPFGPQHTPVAAIGQGTWQISAGRKQAVAALQRGLDLGLTHIDTAEMYEGAEDIVAEAIAGRRGQVFLVSKVLPSNASRTGTIAACERSLAKLRTDHLDCYLLHWPGRHRLEDTIGAFERLVDQGKIRSWGLSNFDVDGLEAADRISGGGRIACNQVLCHLQVRAIEHAVLPWCAARQVSVVAYSPFGSGDFPASGTPGGQVLQRVAAEHGATPRQVALRFLLREAGVFVIPKASSTVHVEENAGAGGLALTRANLAALDAAFPRGRRPATLPML